MGDLDANELDQEAFPVEHKQSVADEFHCDRLLDRVAQVPVKALGSAESVWKTVSRGHFAHGSNCAWCAAS